MSTQTSRSSAVRANAKTPASSAHSNSLAWPDVYEALDNLPRWFGRGLTGPGLMRLEEFTEDGACVVRAEIPGVDPEHDIDITINDSALTITAERKEVSREGQRSEFHYGSFTRHVSLPQGSRSDQVAASYDNGVLEVRVPVEQPHPTWKHVPVMHAAKSKKSH